MLLRPRLVRPRVMFAALAVPPERANSMRPNPALPLDVHATPAPEERPRGASASLRGRRPRVLVLLACYNGADWIGEQLDSILEQEGIELRLVVRDDGSSDTTRREITRFQTDGRLRLCAECRPTGSAAQNFLTLIRDNAADGFDFVAFADQDDIWFRHKLARACRRLIASGAAAYSSSTVATWPNGRMTLLCPGTRSTATDFLFEGAGQGCTFVLRADFYAQVRAFARAHPRLTQRAHYHDWVVYALARAWGYTWFLDPLPTLSYRQHGRNDTGARHTWAGVRLRFARIRSGWYREQLTAIAAICAAAAPQNGLVRGWRSLLLAATRHRRLRLALFCLRGVRRRRVDNLIIAVAAIAGWL